MGTRSKQRVRRETWEAYCETCSWHDLGGFERVMESADGHLETTSGHLVHVVSDWAPFAVRLPGREKSA